MEPVQLTPLHDWHAAHGARMMVAGLWLRPEHYGDATAEVRAVRSAVGLIDVSTLGKFRLVGRGVPALLDRLYINRWDNLGIGRVRYGVMCNDEGVILSLSLIHILAVHSQNAWPSLARDAMALTGLADRFLPVGFYYKAVSYTHLDVYKRQLLSRAIAMTTRCCWPPEIWCG